MFLNLKMILYLPYNGTSWTSASNIQHICNKIQTILRLNGYKTLFFLHKTIESNHSKINILIDKYKIARSIATSSFFVMNHSAKVDKIRIC